mmetsp:Transcript_27888/g.47183  ORF Transcript_27888/g.47183 Transcript_27888/m.47183 type:complete len:131 (-) Transcript_27888:44-436(-)
MYSREASHHVVKGACSSRNTLVSVVGLTEEISSGNISMNSPPESLLLPSLLKLLPLVEVVMGITKDLPLSPPPPLILLLFDVSSLVAVVAFGGSSSSDVMGSMPASPDILLRIDLLLGFNPALQTIALGT